MLSAEINASEIIRYYEECQPDYALVWQLEEAMSMHYGFWEEDSPHHRAAVDRMNQKVAECAGIRKGHHVLDAGYGIGGSSVFLASLGCTIEGITLSQKQVDMSVTMRNDWI